MNIFTAIGTMINSVTNTTVRALATVDTTVDAIHDVAKITKATTSQLLEETMLENQQILESMKNKDKE